MFCIVLFLSAASLFGTIIAQVNELVSQITTKKKDLENILASYVFVKPRLYVSLSYFFLSARTLIECNNHLFVSGWMPKPCSRSESGNDFSLQLIINTSRFGKFQKNLIYNNFEISYFSTKKFWKELFLMRSRYQ